MQKYFIRYSKFTLKKENKALLTRDMIRMISINYDNKFSFDFISRFTQQVTISKYTQAIQQGLRVRNKKQIKPITFHDIMLLVAA